MEEYRTRATKKLLSRMSLKESRGELGFCGRKAYLDMLAEAKHLPKYLAENVQDLNDNLEMLTDGDRVLLREAKYWPKEPVALEPFEISITDSSGQLDLLVNPLEPYMSSRGQESFSFAKAFNLMVPSTEMRRVVLLNLEDMGLFVYSFDATLEPGGPRRRDQKSRNFIKDLFKEPAYAFDNSF